MKMIGAVLAGLLASLCFWGTASAQDVPPGSYLRSCSDVFVQGDTLVATCLRRNGSPHRTSLQAAQNCIGDIGNLNGTLTCNYASGSPAPALQAPDESRETLERLHAL